MPVFIACDYCVLLLLVVSALRIQPEEGHTPRVDPRIHALPEQ